MARRGSRDLEINASTYIAILTHDDKFDEPALAAALNSPARYIGAIGSRRTHRKRVARLQADGILARQVARVRGPIGLDLGSQTAEEVALSVLAEMIAVRRGGSAVPMSEARR